MLDLKLFLGLIISGGSGSVGKSAEVFVPFTGQHCTLPSLPARRENHTMEGRMVCGGDYTLTSCLTLRDGSWESTVTLLQQR